METSAQDMTILFEFQVEEAAILKAVHKVEEEWSQRLQKSINDIKHERLTDKRVQGCQTEQSSDAGGIPEEEMEEKIKAQKLKLQQEAEACQAIAVREAMKKTQGELEKKHQENVAKQVKIHLHQKGKLLPSETSCTVMGGLKKR